MCGFVAGRRWAWDVGTSCLDFMTLYRAQLSSLVCEITYYRFSVTPPLWGVYCIRIKRSRRQESSIYAILLRQSDKLETKTRDAQPEQRNWIGSYRSINSLYATARYEMLYRAIRDRPVKLNMSSSTMTCLSTSRPVQRQVRFQKLPPT